MSTTARVYLGTVWLGSVAVFAVLAWPPYLAAYPLALTLLTVASFLTQVYELEVSPRWFFSTHLTIAATALYVGGPPLGPVAPIGGPRSRGLPARHGGPHSPPG